MPKYFNYMICGYYLYFTTHCIVEAMHVHANKHKLMETGSAKFFVKSNGDSTVEYAGMLDQRELRIIQAFIKENYETMYSTWKSYSNQGFAVFSI